MIYHMKWFDWELMSVFNLYMVHITKLRISMFFGHIPMASGIMVFRVARIFLGGRGT